MEVLGVPCWVGCKDGHGYGPIVIVHRRLMVFLGCWMDGVMSGMVFIDE
jgi:hypothetical protein